MRYAIVKIRNIYTGEQVLFNDALIIDGEHIEGIVPVDKVPKGLEILDLSGDNVAPGFIDVQVNGGGGLLSMTIPRKSVFGLFMQRTNVSARRISYPRLLRVPTTSFFKPWKQMGGFSRNAVMVSWGCTWKGPTSTRARRWFMTRNTSGASPAKN